MIIKRISCQVKKDQIDLFSKLQAQWQPVNSINGFLGQVGGWSIKNELTACVFSFWENKDVYAYFMNNVHDGIFLNTNQSSTYTSIDVELFEEVFNIQGLEKDIVSILRESNFIRTALSNVKEGRASHFIETQSKVWNSGMKKTEKMLGGEFGSSVKDDKRFLVLTGWLSEEAHKDYIISSFSALKSQAKTELDLEGIIGEQFTIENSWRVVPLI
ncbi:YdbC family protein [Peribacillus simplex]|uniref:YdbC family protein n=2 Tax=Peribacillus TaxID=2675229 RepID=A0AA90PFD7_9BACI|nr:MULTISPECIES: YdbC family protein [Peribacillus]MDP1422148.1 YdbC family protein [Peribacillus simplex]MDP1454803.1 YdbC family protein [Peribacillus frigoritolerans]